MVFLWSPGEALVEEDECFKSIKETCEYVLEATQNGFAPLVTGPGPGNPNSHIFTAASPHMIFKEHNKMHGVFVSPEDDHYSLNAMFFHTELAKRYSNFLHTKKEANNVIVSSIEGSLDMKNTTQISRADLDQRGHHYTKGI